MFQNVGESEPLAFIPPLKGAGIPARSDKAEVYSKMQISCRCKHCGHQVLNTNEDQISLEFDFLTEEVRFVCRNKGCKKVNVISFAEKRKTDPLPVPVAVRG